MKVKNVRMLAIAALAAIIVSAGMVACGGEALGVKFKPVLDSATTGKHDAKIVIGGVILTPVNPPQGGTVTVELQWTSTRLRQRWHFAGRKSVNASQLQTPNVPVDVLVEYAYLTPKTYWRVYIVWDGVAADGTPDSGHEFVPNEHGERLAKPSASILAEEGTRTP